MNIEFLCPYCGQSMSVPPTLGATTFACPGCGKAVTAPPPAPPPLPRPAEAPACPPQTSGMAIASMVVGIIGLVGGWVCCPFVLPIVAIALGHAAYAVIARQPDQLSGRGFAIAGFTLGYAGLVFGIISSIFFALLLFGIGEASRLMNAM